MGGGYGMEERGGSGVREKDTTRQNKSVGGRAQHGDSHWECEGLTSDAPEPSKRGDLRGGGEAVQVPVLPLFQGWVWGTEQCNAGISIANRAVL